MAQQIFKFEERHDYLPENFLVSVSNQDAFDAACNFTNGYYALNIYGQKASGKTFLAQIAGHKNPNKKIHFIENLDKSFEQADLLELLNKAQEGKEFVFITSIKSIADLPFTLPDLTSRLKAIPAVGIAAPGEQLLYMMLARLFSARQIKVSDDVINYLCSRVERSFEQMHNIVNKIDNLSLAQKRSITLPLIKNVVNAA